MKKILITGIVIASFVLAGWFAFGKKAPAPQLSTSVPEAAPSASEPVSSSSVFATPSTTPKAVLPSGWVEYRDPSGFSFLRPAALELQPADPQAPSTAIFVWAGHGAMAVYVRDVVLDPDNIQGPNGKKVENVERVTVGDRQGYSYALPAQDGYTGLMVKTPLGQKTLFTSFGVSERDASASGTTSLIADRDLRERILRTFSFAKATPQ